MRKYFLLIAIAFLGNTGIVTAQQPGVAINTTGTAPHSGAMLDVQSTDKGILIPRMTTSQRTAISNLVKGLLVFDNTTSSFWFYNGTMWTELSSGSGSSQWTSSANNIINNNSGNVGIGNIAPTAKLHVAGSIKNTGRIDADGVIEGAGLSSLGALYVNSSSLLTGAVTGNSSASFGGNINSNTSMSINDAAGIFSFKSGSSDKGFAQLSGNDLRIGTYSSNTEGSLVVRTNGADQVKINNDGLALQNHGKIIRPGSGSNDLLPVCYGIVVYDGRIDSESNSGNFTVEKLGTGHYRITYNDPAMIGEDGKVTVLLTPFSSITPRIMNVTRMLEPSVEVKSFTLNGYPDDTNFAFIMYR